MFKIMLLIFQACELSIICEAVRNLTKNVKKKGKIEKVMDLVDDNT